MAKVFLETGDDYKVSNSNTTVYGVAGDDTDSVVIESGITGVSVNANVDRVDFAGNIADFTFEAGFGANMMVYAADGTTLLATIPLQEDANGTQLVFADGAVASIYDAATNSIATGGVALTDTAAVIAPAAADIDETTTTAANLNPGVTVPSFSINTAEVAEGSTATFTVTLSQAQAADTTVDYAVSLEGTTSAADHGDITADGTASTGTGTLNFAAGETTKTITIPITEDVLSPEDGEGITVTLSNPTGADSQLADTAAVTANITDVPVSYTLTQSTDNVQEGDTVIYTLTASAANTVDSNIDFSVIPGDTTALDQGSNNTNLNDFSQGAFNPSTVTLAAGETTVQFTLDTEDDGITELPEDFQVQAVREDGTSTITTTLLDGSGTETGQTYTLTTGIDAPGSTSGNDTYIGANDGNTNTVNLGDTINGGVGDDTLQMNVANDGGGGTDPSGDIDLISVETVRIRNTDPDTDNDANEWNGVENLHFYKDTTATAVSNLQNNVNIMITEQTSAVALDVDFVGTAFDNGATLDLTLTNTDATGDGGTTDDTTLTVNTIADSFATLDITSNGTANDLFLDLHDGADVTDTLTTITATGAGSLNLEVADDELESLTTVDVSGMTGNFTLNLAAQGAQNAGTATAITVTGGSGSDRITTTANGDTVTGNDGNDTITGGAGNDTLSGNAGNDTIATGAGTDTVDAGAGDDTVVVGANLDTADNIDAGDGTDTLSLTSAEFLANQTGTGGSALGVLSGFEHLLLSDSFNAGATVDISDYGINYIAFGVAAGGAGILTGNEAISGFTSGATIEIRQNGTEADADVLTIGMTDATDAGTNSDELNVLFNSDLEDGDGAANSPITLDIDGINILNVTSSDLTSGGESLAAGTLPLSDDGYTLTTNGNANDANLSTINIDGEQAVTYTVAASATALATINGQNSNGDITINADAFAGTQGITITTGAGNDTVEGSEDLADLISLGAGNDTYQMTAGAGATEGGDSVDLGTGADTVELDVAAASPEANMLSVTNFNPVLSATEADTLEFVVAAVTADVAAANAVDVSGADADAVAVANSIVAVVTDGIITISGDNAGSIDTLAEWLDVADVAGVVTDGSVAGFEFNGNTYALETTVGTAAANDGAVDNVVELIGVTGVDAIAVAAADNTILIA